MFVDLLWFCLSNIESPVTSEFSIPYILYLYVYIYIMTIDIYPHISQITYRAFEPQLQNEFAHRVDASCLVQNAGGPESKSHFCPVSKRVPFLPFCRCNTGN